MLEGVSSLGGGDEGHRLHERPIRSDRAHHWYESKLVLHLVIRSQDLGLHWLGAKLVVLDWVSTVDITGLVHRFYSTANFKFSSLLLLFG